MTNKIKSTRPKANLRFTNNPTPPPLYSIKPSHPTRSKNNDRIFKGRSAEKFFNNEEEDGMKWFGWVEFEEIGKDDGRFVKYYVEVEEGDEFEVLEEIEAIRRGWCG